MIIRTEDNTLKKISIIILIALIFSIGSSSDVKMVDDLDKKIEITPNYIDLYQSFLEGKFHADNQGEIISINEVFLSNENYNRFTLFDSNGNGIPELHLSSMRAYLVIECQDDRLIVVYSGSGYDNLLNNGAILYIREGGGPEHISYRYTKLGVDNKVTQVSFEKYNTQDDLVDDVYLYEDKEVDKKEFDEKTRVYLTIGSDEINWLDYWQYLIQKK